MTRTSAARLGHVTTELFSNESGRSKAMDAVSAASCRPAAVALLQDWHALLADPAAAYAPSTRTNATFAVTDQLALNILLERGMAPVASAAAAGADWRVIAAANGTVALLPLPALLFANGHVFFYQHLPQAHGVKVCRQHAWAHS